MCKVLMIAGIKSEHLPKVHKFLKIAAKNMSFIEDDGVGYAAITNTGKIYGEKWRNKEDAFNIHDQPENDPVINHMDSLLGEIADWEKTPNSGIKVYDSFGDRSLDAIDNTVAVMLHARKATFNSDKTIENVHPFTIMGNNDQPDTALIHNGTIINHTKLTKTMSTCDSEVILHEYLANMMYHNPWGIEQLAKTVIGDYTVGVLSSMLDSDGSNTPILDIFKSSKELCVGWVPELETMVFCTIDHTLTNSCKEAGLTIKNIVKIKDGFLLRINAITGSRITDLIPFEVSARWDNNYTQNHTHSMVRGVQGPQMKEVKEIKSTDDDTLESVKRNFERRHPSLFTSPYVEVKKDLEEHEKQLFQELDKNNQTNHKALHLVAIALAAVKG